MFSTSQDPEGLDPPGWHPDLPDQYLDCPKHAFYQRILRYFPNLDRILDIRVSYRKSPRLNQQFLPDHFPDYVKHVIYNWILQQSCIFCWIRHIESSDQKSHMLNHRNQQFHFNIMLNSLTRSWVLIWDVNFFCMRSNVLDPCKIWEISENHLRQPR